MYIYIHMQIHITYTHTYNKHIHTHRPPSVLQQIRDDDDHQQDHRAAQRGQGRGGRGIEIFIYT
jgi:hypothetical protein